MAFAGWAEIAPLAGTPALSYHPAACLRRFVASRVLSLTDHGGLLYGVPSRSPRGGFWWGRFSGMAEFCRFLSVFGRHPVRQYTFILNNFLACDGSVPITAPRNWGCCDWIGLRRVPFLAFRLASYVQSPALQGIGLLVSSMPSTAAS